MMNDLRDSRWRWLGPALILLLALLLRAHDLQQFPHLTDETGEVLWAHAIAYEGLRPLTHTDAYNGPFWAYLLAGALGVFGSSATLPRVFALFLGLCGVGATMMLAKTLAPERHRSKAGLIAGLLMATSYTPVVVASRVAWSNCSTPLWTTLTTLALLAAVRGEHPRSVAQRHDSSTVAPDVTSWRGPSRWLLAGLLAGLSLQSHPSVIVYLLGLAIWLLLRPERRALLRSTTGPWLALVASLLAYSPVIVFNIQENFQTLAEASASGNWAPGDVAPGPAGTLAAIAQLGRSMLGGFDLNGPSNDPVWVVLSWAWALFFLGIAVLPLISRWTGKQSPEETDVASTIAKVAHPLGRRLPGTLVLVALLGLPLFNRNWHGFLEARYLGYTLPLLYAAFAVWLAPRLRLGDASSTFDKSKVDEMPRSVAAATPTSTPVSAANATSISPSAAPLVTWPIALLALLVLLPAARGFWIVRDGQREQFDNRRLWSMHAQAIAAEAEGAAVYVDRELKQVAWRAGGQPRRGVEYLLTMDGVPYVQAPAEKMNHFLGVGDDLVMFLAGETADTLREWGHGMEPLDIDPRPGEEAWGLYRTAHRR